MAWWAFTMSNHVPPAASASATEACMAASVAKPTAPNPNVRREKDMSIV
jgi:hypothetical protein